MGTISAGRLLGRVLRTAGVDAVYGEPLPGVDVVPVADPVVAGLLAAAHTRVLGTPALAHAIGVLWAGSGAVHDVTDAAALAGEVGWLAGGNGLRLRIDLAEHVADTRPTPAPPRPSPGAGDEVVEALASSSSPMVLAGPGVVAGQGVPGLHALAGAGSLGVLNTWGAKGVFDWRSPHHLATAGLQARDFELGGIADADLVLATGIDWLEAPDRLWRDGRRVVEVAADDLAPLARRWSRPAQEIPVPPLREGLAAATQAGWATTTSPMPPSLVTRHYGSVGSGGGMVAADPGVAGYWVARTFATTELGGVIVPAEPHAQGMAAACCLVARRHDPRRPVLAAVDEVPEGVLDAAATLGIAIPVEVWSPEGRALDAEQHQARLRSMLAADRSTVESLATDAAQLDRMLEVAGEIIAWTNA